jgi:hypothetical protein
MRGQKQNPRGFDFNIEQAMQAGAAIFQPFFTA